MAQVTKPSRRATGRQVKIGSQQFKKEDVDKFKKQSIIAQATQQPAPQNPAIQQAQAQQQAQEKVLLGQKQQATAMGLKGSGDLLTPEMAQQVQQNELLKQQQLAAAAPILNLPPEPEQQGLGVFGSNITIPDIAGAAGTGLAAGGAAGTIAAGVGAGVGLAAASPVLATAAGVGGAIWAATYVLGKINFQAKNQATNSAKIYEGAKSSLKALTRLANTGQAEPLELVDLWNANINEIARAEYELTKLQANDLKYFYDSNADKELLKIKQFRRDYDVLYKQKFMNALQQPNILLANEPIATEQPAEV